MSIGCRINFGSYGTLATGGAKVYNVNYRESSGLDYYLREKIVEEGLGSAATVSGGKITYSHSVKQTGNYIRDYEFSIVFRNKFPTNKYLKVVAEGDYTFSGYADANSGRGNCFLNLFGVKDDNTLSSGDYMPGNDFHDYSPNGSSTVDVSKIDAPWFGIEINGFYSCNLGWSSGITVNISRIYGLLK